MAQSPVGGGRSRVNLGASGSAVTVYDLHSLVAEVSKQPIKVSHGMLQVLASFQQVAADGRGAAAASQCDMPGLVLCSPLIANCVIAASSDGLTV